MPELSAGVGSGGDAPVRPSTAPQGDATGVPGVPGSPEGAQGISAPREACRICGHLTDSGKVCGPCRAAPGVLDAAVERAEQAEAAIARVKGLHSEIPYKPGSCYCSNPYPCPTIRALDGAGAVPGEQTGSGND